MAVGGGWGFSRAARESDTGVQPSVIMFYYQTEVLHLEASFLGTARVIGWFSLMLGTYIYNRYLKHKKLRNILM